MASYNKVILIGNLTRDVELRHTAKGTAIANLSLAVNREWKDPNSGEKRTDVCYIECKSFGKQAEVLAQYLAKGNPLMLEGRLNLESWEDKNTGSKRSKLGVIIESFQFIGVKSDAKPGTSAPAPKPAAEPEIPVDSDDDVPF